MGIAKVRKFEDIGLHLPLNLICICNDPEAKTMLIHTNYTEAIQLTIHHNRM